MASRVLPAFLTSLEPLVATPPVRGLNDSAGCARSAGWSSVL